MATAQQQIRDIQQAGDPKIEADLKRLSIEFELVSRVPPGSFDMKRSLDNQVRMGKPLDKQTVNRYTEGVRNGDRFPPVCVQQLPSGLYLILDGNHRTEAHRSEGKPLDVYVCSAPEAVLVRYSFEANAKHGLPASAEERLHHALYMCDNGMSLREAAQRFQIPQSRLQVASLAQNAGRRSDDIGIPRQVWQGIAQTSLARLNSIRTDEGFAAALQLVVDARLKSDQIARLLTDLAEVRGSASKQISVVDRWRAELRLQIGKTTAGAGGRRHGVMSPKAKLRAGIGQLMSLTDPTLLDEVPPVERLGLAKEVKDTIEKLQRIKAHLERDGGA